MQLRQRLEDWRGQRPGRSPIPEPFWTEASVLARTEGVSRVARILRLHYQRLKDRLNGPPPKPAPVAAPAFVELTLPPSVHSGRECLVEMTHRTGAKMTLHLPEASSTLRLIKSKVGRERLLPLPQRLGKALASYLRWGRPAVVHRQVFLCHHFPYGSPLSTGQVGYAIRKAFTRAGLSVTRTHLLRHSFATNLHQQGASVKALADGLGHQAWTSPAQVEPSAPRPRS